MIREGEYLLRCFPLVELLHFDNSVVTENGDGNLNLGSHYKGDKAMLLSYKALG